MQVIIKPTAIYMCGNCKCQLHYIYGSKEDNISGIVTAKCINPECENRGKIVKIHPQIVEIEPESHVQD